MARAARTSRRGKTGTVITLNLAGIEGRVLLPEDEYLVKVDEVTCEEGDKAEYFKWKFKVADGKYEDKGVLWYNTSLAENSLWNLKGLLEALNVEIPEDEFDLDLKDMVDLEVMVAVEHETYDGKKQSKIVDFWPAEEKPEPRRGRGSSRREEPELRRGRREEPGEKPRRGRAKAKEEVTQEQIDDMDQKELEDLVDELKLDVNLSKFRTLSKMRAAVIDAAEAENVLAK